MELPEGLRLTIEDKPASADRNALNRALTVFNRQFLPNHFWARVEVFVRDDAGTVLAGLDGEVYAEWLFVNNLWVHADLRGRGIGRELMGQAERRALTLGCHSAWLDTWSFQAPGFYQRLGYQAFGALDYPPRHRRYFLWKPLVPAAAGNSVGLFPVSVKGVLFEDGRVVLLENERGEWELPGGRLEPGEAPMACVVREFGEEIGIKVSVETLIDSWVYEVLPQREVVILSYGVRRADDTPLRLGGEHRRLGLFAAEELDGLAMPEGYRRSVRAWAAQSGLAPPTAG